MLPDKVITGFARKHSPLLHLAGPATHDLFETLTEPTPAVEECFERTIQRRQLTTAKNTPLERHGFRQIAPNSGETAHQFVARFRLPAQHCDFTDVEDQIRDQLVEKIGPVQLR